MKAIPKITPEPKMGNDIFLGSIRIKINKPTIVPTQQLLPNETNTPNTENIEAIAHKYLCLSLSNNNKAKKKGTFINMKPP